MGALLGLKKNEDENLSTKIEHDENISEMGFDDDSLSHNT